jgi:hypothetical protein
MMQAAEYQAVRAAREMASSLLGGTITAGGSLREGL